MRINRNNQPLLKLQKLADKPQDHTLINMH